MSDAGTCGDMRICLSEEQPFAAMVRGGRMVKREFVLGTSDLLRRSACHARKRVVKCNFLVARRRPFARNDGQMSTTNNLLKRQMQPFHTKRKGRTAKDVVKRK